MCAAQATQAEDPQKLLWGTLAPTLPCQQALTAGAGELIHLSFLHLHLHQLLRYPGWAKHGDWTTVQAFLREVAEENASK